MFRLSRFIAGFSTVVCASGMLACGPGVLHAQWLNYPTAGVPKLPNGKPNLAAPPRRTRDGKPDFSGMWLESDAMVDTACPPAETCIRQEPLPRRAVHIGISSAEELAAARKGGDSYLFGLLPYTAWAIDVIKQRRSANQSGAKGRAEELIDPHARCLPPNFPRAWALPQYKKIIQTKGLLLILHEFDASYRQIFLDGRPLPNDPEPAWSGYSIGHWDGDTLVVESAGFRDDLWLDLFGSPLTEAAKVTERIGRPNFGTLTVEVTVDDPKAYTKAWTVRMDQSIVLGTELLDDMCVENERDVDHYTP